MNEKKEILPGVKGENGSDDWSIKGNDALISSSDNETINLTQLATKCPKARSKQTIAIRPILNFVIGRLSAGQPVSEQDVFENSSSRYRRSESLMILREVHRRYPRQTVLALRQGPGAGMWVLLPVRRRP